MTPQRYQSGATLIELVVSIVIISISVTSLMMLITQTARSSADPMVRTQATSIAQAYMEEILTQTLNDPDGDETGGSETGEVRSTFDGVSDYHNLSDNSGARDQYGNLISGLEGYNVNVVVSATTLETHPAKKIIVTVTFDGNANFSIPLSSYRLN